MFKKIPLLLLIMAMLSLIYGCGLFETTTVTQAGMQAAGIYVSSGSDEPEGTARAGSPDQNAEGKYTGSTTVVNGQKTTTATPGSDQTNAASGKAQTTTVAGSAQNIMVDAAAHGMPSQVYRGEPFVINVSGEGLLQMTVVWRDRQITVQAGQNGQAQNACRVALSTPLGEKAGSLPLNVYLVWADRQETIRTEIAIGKRKYQEQHLTVAQKYVTPDPSVTKKIQQDRINFKNATSGISSYKHWDLPMFRPVPGSISSTYGLRRFFNGEERAPHRGLDFRAKTGDPIMALAGGTVTLAEEQYYGGNTVIIDHGLGVFSVYMHLSAFKVKVGDTVDRGQLIGLIGQTGRVTGPHLHLSMVVQEENIDPAPFLDL